MSGTPNPSIHTPPNLPPTPPLFSFSSSTLHLKNICFGSSSVLALHFCFLFLILIKIVDAPIEILTRDERIARFGLDCSSKLEWRNWYVNKRRGIVRDELREGKEG
jgi:hypothetical protein